MKNNAFFSIIRMSSGFFTAFVLLIYAGVELSGAGDTYGLFPSAVFALFVFSFILSCANVFFSRSKLNTSIKYFIHLALTLTAEIILLRFVNGLRGQTMLVAAVLTAVLHAVIFSVVLTVKKASKKDEKYESLYGKLK